MDGQRYSIPQGTSYLIQPGSLSDLWSSRGSRPVWVHFDVMFDARRAEHPHVVGYEPELGDRTRFLQPRATEVWGVDLPVLVPKPLQAAFRQRLLELVRTWHQRTELCVLRATHQLNELLLRMVEHERRSSAPEFPSLEYRILQAENVARQSLGAAFGVDEFAACAGLSRSRFSVLYKEFRGASPGAFLRRERMQLAVELLARTSLPVSEVGAKSVTQNPPRLVVHFAACSVSRPATGDAPRCPRARVAHVNRRRIPLLDKVSCPCHHNCECRRWRVAKAA